MAERGGRFIVHHDGTTMEECFDLPDGTTAKAVEAFSKLDQPKNPMCFLVNRRVYEMLKAKA